MKNVRLFLSAIAVFSIVGSALAFKVKDQGSVYCNSSCNNRKDFRVTSGAGTTQDPCNNGAGKEYILAPTCIEVNATQAVNFEPVSQ